MKRCMGLLATGIFLSSLPAPVAAAAPPTISEEEAKAFQQMFGKGPQEEDVYRTDRLLLTATGSLKPVHLAPSVASVITAEDIKAIGAKTLDEALETVPGLHVFPDQSVFLDPSFAVRGIVANLNNQVLLLINGVPLVHPGNGIRPAGYRMPVAMISRIEVVRGPGSAIHGADAFAGTINVITKDGQEVDGTRAGGGYGSFETKTGWLQHGGNYGGWDVVAGLAAQRSDGDKDRIVTEDTMSSTALGGGVLAQTPSPLKTDYEVTQGHLGLRKAGLSFSLLGAHSRSSMGHSGLQIVHSDVGYAESSYAMADLVYQNTDLAANWDLSLKLNSVYMDSFSMYDFLPHELRTQQGKPMDTSWTNGLEAVGIYSGLNQHRLRFSLGSKFVDTNTDQEKNFGPGVTDQFGPLVNIRDTPYAYMYDQNRTIRFATLQDEWSFARTWELTAGVRYDHYSDFGDTINPRLALVWETRYDLTSKLMYGRAFRAPSFGEQYFVNNPITLGNPDLAPETIDTYELAFDYQPTRKLRARCNFFYYEIGDQIDYVDSGNGTKTARNVNDVKGHGFELEADYQVLDNLQLKANLAHQRSKNRETKEIVPDTPAWQFYADAEYRFLEHWSLDGQYLRIADRYRAADDPREEIKDNDLVNLTLTRNNILKHWQATLAVRNVFDEDIREPSPPASAPFDKGITYDYPMEGRAIYGELQWHY